MPGNDASWCFRQILKRSKLKSYRLARKTRDMRPACSGFSFEQVFSEQTREIVRSTAGFPDARRHPLRSTARPRCIYLDSEPPDAGAPLEAADLAGTSAGFVAPAPDAAGLASDGFGAGLDSGLASDAAASPLASSLASSLGAGVT